MTTRRAWIAFAVTLGLLACQPDPAPTSERKVAEGSEAAEADPGPLTIPVDPKVGPFVAPPDRSESAAKRTPWDNFTTADRLVVNRTDMSPMDSLESKWVQYKADPVGSMLKDGQVNFQLVNSMYRADILRFEDREKIVADMKAAVAAAKGDATLKGNLLVALVHIGFEEEALELLEEYKKEPWFSKNWDANFFAATLLFRHRRYAEAVPFLEAALLLNPDDWTKLWLRLALFDQPGPEAEARRRELFAFGEHMGKGDPAEFPFRDKSDAWGMRRWHLAGAVAFTAGDRTTSEVVGEAQLVWDTAFVSEGTDVIVDADLVATGESRSITIADAALPTRSDEDLELWLIGVDAAGELTIQTLGIIDDAAAPGSYDIPADFDLDGFDQVLVDISFEPRDGVEAHSGASIVRGPVTDV